MEKSEIEIVVSQLQGGNNLKTIQSGRQFPSLQKVWTHNLSIKKLRGEKGKWKI